MSFKYCFIAFCLLNGSQLKGQTWQWVGPDSVEINHLFVKEDTMYAATRNLEGISPNQYYVGTVMRSTNGGARWDTISNTLPSTRFRELELRDISAFAVEVADLQTIYAAVSGLLYKTKSGGNSWELLSDTTNRILDNVSYLLISPYNNKTVFAIDNKGFGGSLENLYRTTDGGTTWQFVGGDFPVSDHGVHVEIAFDPVDSTRVYAVADNSFFRVFFRSADGGVRWDAVSYCQSLRIAFGEQSGKPVILNYRSGLYHSSDGGLNWVGPVQYLGFLDIKPSNKKSHNLFAVAKSAQYGIYSSIDGGRTWSLLRDSHTLQLYDDGTLSQSLHSKVAIDNFSSLLYVGTKAGVYRHVIPVFVEGGQDGRIPKEYGLHQNYPNPFNSTTIISYALPKQSHIQLKVFDFLGKEVRILVDATQMPGEYKVPFEASDLPSGVYIYRLIAGSNVLVRKAVVIK